VKKIVFNVAFVLLVACGGQPDTQAVVTSAVTGFDCNASGQRLSCAAPTKPHKRFVCHATGAPCDPYVKLEVSIHSSHTPGVPHRRGGTPDQSPGASGDDLGSGPGLDCDCNLRTCEDTCTGAPGGATCDDGDVCTGDGSCQGDSCEPGAPRCTAGTPVDACTVENGTCDAGTGACGTEPLPAGTPCGPDQVCDLNGSCIAVAHIAINEIESSGGTPGDWVELINIGAAPADVSGWRFLDNDPTHTPFVVPAGTVIPVAGFLVLDEASFGFGLGAADSARLFDATGALVDSHSWTAHAPTTYGRCPNGSGPFEATASVTKGAANSCSGGPSPDSPWPGQNAVTTVDATGGFGGNLSGLFYEPATPPVLWAVRNGPSTLYRLRFDGAIWTPEVGTGWDAGRTLRYPDGTGGPDAEDVTRAETGSSAIYVATERDNDNDGVSRPSILRFDASQPGGELVATHEWNLASDLPVVGANLGLEAIAWIPDSFLVAHSLFDAAAGLPYDPARYPGHGTGLILVGIEATGAIHAYALDHVGGGFTRIATIATDDASSKAIAFDPDSGYLWAHCGVPCGNRTTVLAIDTTSGSPGFGRFAVVRRFARPSTMPNLANEGIAIAPDARCAGGFKDYLWTDDGETGGHSLRRDSIPCGPFLP
jgi:hypothetical protein